MAKQTKPTNPFYVVLVVLGVAFLLTACAYAVMTVQMLDPSRTAEASPSSQALLEFLDAHGAALLMVELALLAIAAVAAIALDGYSTRRGASSGRKSPQSAAEAADNKVARSN